MHSIIVYCPRGLEECLAHEIQEIIGQDSQVYKGYVSLKGGWQEIYALNLNSRLASRVLLQIKEGTIHNENDLYQLACSVNWERFFKVDKTIKINVEGRASWVRRFDFLALKIKDGLCDAFIKSIGRRPNVDKSNPDIRIYGYINEKKAVLYLDTSGEGLFKRGFRERKGLAPIKENLAAGLLKLAGYQSRSAFTDPLCGSGTLAIEAALMAANIPPGRNRPFAFERFASFNALLWRKVKEEYLKNIHPPSFPILASDSQREAVDQARHNAEIAGVADFISFDHRGFADVKAPAQNGILLSNPPYGERLSTLKHVQESYPDWGRYLKQNFVGWKVGFISADPSLPRLMRLKPARKIPLFNGKIECRLFLFDIVAGSNRK